MSFFANLENLSRFAISFPELVDADDAKLSVLKLTRELGEFGIPHAKEFYQSISLSDVAASREAFLTLLNDNCGIGIRECFRKWKRQNKRFFYSRKVLLKMAEGIMIYSLLSSVLLKLHKKSEMAIKHVQRASEIFYGYYHPIVKPSERFGEWIYFDGKPIDPDMNEDEWERTWEEFTKYSMLEDKLIKVLELVTGKTWLPKIKYVKEIKFTEERGFRMDGLYQGYYYNYEDQRRTIKNVGEPLPKYTRVIPDPLNNGSTKG